MNFLEQPYTASEIRKMTRKELWDYLEHRGFAVYSNETTKELRDAAFEDARTGGKE